MPGGAEAGEDVFEPSLEVDLVVFAGGHEAGDDGGFFAAALVANEEPILLPRAHERMAFSAGLLSMLPLQAVGPRNLRAFLPAAIGWGNGDCAPRPSTPPDMRFSASGG